MFFSQLFSYLCHVVRTDARMGGRRAAKHIKGVESTSYLRHLESGKFNNLPLGKAVFNAHWFVFSGMSQ